TSLNEHLIRTITARRNLSEDTMPFYEETLKAEKRQGFFYIDMLSDKIASYEANREKYQVQLPFTVATNKIVSDHVYEGTHLRLITALPHPSNTTQRPSYLYRSAIR
ncbi:MAG: DUF4932 domain-containing protein, partial [Niameybacter sp.]